jgi:hypothetical protein
VPGFSVARAVDHRRQRCRDAGICIYASEDQPGELAAYGPGLCRAWAGVSQHLVAVCPGGLCDQPRRQIYAGHQASCPRIRLTATFLISHNPQNTVRVHCTTTSFRPVPAQITQASSGLAIQ